MSQVLSFDMPLPDLGPRPGSARKATPDSDQAEAGHSFRRLLDRHAETALAEEGGADEPPSPDAPSDQDAEAASDDPSLAAAFAAIPSPVKDVAGEPLMLPGAASASLPVDGAEVKGDAVPVAILPLGVASGLSPQQAAVAAALFAGKSPLAVSGIDPSSVGDIVNQQPPIPVSAEASAAPAIAASTAVLAQDPVTGTVPEFVQAAKTAVSSQPEVPAAPTTAADNIGSKPLPNLANQSAVAFAGAQGGQPTEAVPNDTRIVAPVQPTPPQVPPLKKETDAVATPADADLATQRPAASVAPTFDAFTTPGPLADSPREVANHYHRVGDATHRALSDGTMSPADQVSLRIMHGLAEGRRAIQVQLHPAELGSIDVKMHWQGDRLTAQFVVDRPETLELLQRDARALERALGGAGIDLADSGLSFSLKDQGGGQQDGRVPGAMTVDASPLGEPQEIAADEPLGQIVRDGIISIRV